MKFITFNKEYKVTECTAIALCDHEAEEDRQEALLVESLFNGEKTEFVVFGWYMPKNNTDFMDMCDDPDAWENLEDAHRVRK